MNVPEHAYATGRSLRRAAKRPLQLAIVMATVISLVLPSVPPALANGPDTVSTGQYAYPFQDPALSPDARVRDLMSRLTLDEKVGLLHQFSGAIIRLGVPQFRTGTEGLHGLSWLGYATVFPQNTGLASMWDKALSREIGEVIGREARAYNSVDARFNGIDVWAPVVDLARDPRSGRGSESMGEDAYLAGMVSTYLAKGMQGADPFYYQTIPTLKHFTAYGQEAQRATYSANASPRNLYEYYFRAFQYGIEAGAANGVMTAYNLVNGKPTMTMPEIMSTMYGEWVPGGYSEGAFFNVTDAFSPSNLSGANAYYPNSTLGQAAGMADSLNNGVAAMTPGDTDTPTTRRWIYEALARGMVTEAAIDEAVYGILRVRLHAGDLDAHPTNPFKQLNKRNALTTEEHSALAARAAREQVVLLKNDGGILPLSKSLPTVALVGPLADENSTDFYAGTYPYTTLIRDEVEEKLAGGADALAFTRGLDIVALQVTNGTGTPNGRFLVAGPTPAAGLTGTGTSASDPLAQFYHYDYGYNNRLLRSVEHDRYVAARGPGNTFVVNADPPGFEGVNRASQQWTTDQNFGIVGQSGDVVSLRFGKGTGIVAPNAAANVFVNTAAPFNVQHNGNNSSANRQFTMVTVHDGVDDAVAKATGADVAVVAVGDQPHMTSRETQDRLNSEPDIKLPPYQEELIAAVAEANPNTIVVIVGSYPFDVRNVQANPNVKGIVYTSHAGQDLGTAVADVLFGDYAPAGKLNQTWYPGLDVLPTISDYDIIKGKRTYQYYDGEVIYPFGYGLSYTTVEYSDLTVSPGSAANTGNPDVTVRVSITNTGDVASDEVVELNARYADAAASRVEHPLKTLIGFERVHLAAGATKQVTLTAKLSDLAIWDVSADRFFVEPGTYEFMVGRSSADADVAASGTLTVTGAPLPARDLTETTPAFNFDDYSFTDVTTTGLRADVIPSAVHEDDSYGFLVRKAGGWVRYAEVDVTSPPEGLVLRASNSNAGPAEIQVWMDGPSAGQGGTQLGTVLVPATGHIQTFVNVGAPLSGFAGSTADLYLVFPSANVSVKSLRLGPVSPAASSDVVVTSNHFNSNVATSLTRFHVKVPAVISQRGGSLILEAMIDGSGTVDSRPTWSVTAEDGGPTSLATINASGQLTATTTVDGTVRAVATFSTANGPISGSLSVDLRNMAVAANTNPDAVIIRSGFDSRPPDISWGPNQFTNFGTIHKYQGTLLLSAVTYPLTANPARPVTCSLGDVNGDPTELATIISEGAGFIEGQTSGNNNRAYNCTVQATGSGDGDVYLTATTTNGLSYTTKIVIQNQTTRDPYAARYEAELFDAAGNVGGGSANLRADNVHGDDVGLQLNRIRNGDFAVYRNVDFRGGQVVDLTLKYVKVSSEPATIRVLVDDPVDGTEIGRLAVAGEVDITSEADYRNIVYRWKEATIGIDAPSGVHDMYLVFDVSPNVPNTDISSTYGAVAGWLDLGVNWFKLSYQFDGFFAPMKNPPAFNQIKAGSNVPVRFSLGADLGTTGIIAEGYPNSAPVNCSTGAPTGPAIPASSTAGLVWTGDTYQFDWKTEKSWKGTCRQLVVQLTDASTHTLLFSFK
jgi:beta-glucosidase